MVGRVNHKTNLCNSTGGRFQAHPLSQKQGTTKCNTYSIALTVCILCSVDNGVVHASLDRLESRVAMCLRGPGGYTRNPSDQNPLK